MKLYLAGNFPLLNSVDKERELMNEIHAAKRPYHRLASFFYPKTVNTLLTLKKESEECSKVSPSKKAERTHGEQSKLSKKDSLGSKKSKKERK